MAQPYPINVFWSDEDGAWVADVAELEVAIEAWLETARSSGRPVPPPSARSVHA